MTAKKSSLVHPPHKTKYRVANWADYEHGLRSRGAVTIWFTDDAVEAWTPPRCGNRGGQRRYSDLAIEAALTLRAVFHLPLRQTEGFVGSLLRLMDLDLDAPDHTTLSRRGRHLDVALRSSSATGPIHLIVDSTGLEVVGQGQWAAAKHGSKGVRGWRKLHVGVDDNGVIVAQVATDSATDDASVVPQLLDQVHSAVHRFTGDGAYDKWAVYESLTARGATVVVPPSRAAAVSGTGTVAAKARDAAVARVGEIGRGAWKREAGYHLQARAENAMFRYKCVVGPRLRGRRPDVQEVEVRVACNVLNRMLELGAPASFAVGR